MFVLGKKMIGFDESIRIIAIAFGKVILEFPPRAYRIDDGRSDEET
jgi:hypothetical protein